MHSTKNLRVLFTTLLVTLPSLANVGSLLFLLLFVYSIMGMQLFAFVKFGDTLDEHANFHDFWSSFITLVRFVAQVSGGLGVGGAGPAQAFSPTAPLCFTSGRFAPDSCVNRRRLERSHV